MLPFNFKVKDIFKKLPSVITIILQNIWLKSFYVYHFNILESEPSSTYVSNPTITNSYTILLPLDLHPSTHVHLKLFCRKSQTT